MKCPHCQKHITITIEAAATPIEEMEIGVRAFKIIQGMGITHVNELQEVTAKEIGHQRAIKHIREAMKNHGFTLKGE